MHVLTITIGSLVSVGDPKAPLTLIRLEEGNGDLAKLTFLSKHESLAIADAASERKELASSGPVFEIEIEQHLDFILGEEPLGWMQACSRSSRKFRLGFELPREISVDRAKVAAEKAELETIVMPCYVRQHRRGRASINLP